MGGKTDKQEGVARNAPCNDPTPHRYGLIKNPVPHLPICSSDPRSNFPIVHSWSRLLAKTSQNVDPGRFSIWIFYIMLQNLNLPQTVESP